MYNFNLEELDYIRSNTIDSKYINYVINYFILNLLIYTVFTLIDFYIHLKVENVSIILFIIMFSITFISGISIVLSLFVYFALSKFKMLEHYGIFKNIDELHFEFNKDYIKSSKSYFGIKFTNKYSIYKVDKKYVANNVEDIINRSKVYYDYVNILNRKTLD